MPNISDTLATTALHARGTIHRVGQGAQAVGSTFAEKAKRLLSMMKNLPNSCGVNSQLPTNVEHAQNDPYLNGAPPRTPRELAKTKGVMTLTPTGGRPIDNQQGQRLVPDQDHEVTLANMLSKSFAASVRAQACMSLTQENLDFIVAVNQLNGESVPYSIVSNGEELDAEGIMKYFISDSSNCQVNLSGDLRSRLDRSFNDYKTAGDDEKDQALQNLKDLLGEARTEIKNLFCSNVAAWRGARESDTRILEVDMAETGAVRENNTNR